MQKRIPICFTLVALCLFGHLEIMVAQCSEDANYWTESWRSCEQSANPNPGRGTSYWILYEFTEPIGIGKTHIWNANKQGQSESGIKTVFVDISIDGTNWQQVGNEAFEWEKAPESSDYEGFEGPILSTYGLVKKVLLTVESTHGDACASLAEIRFEVDKDACSGQLDACGVCDGPGEIKFYLDADGDGQGNQNIFIQSCEDPGQGYVDNNTDNCDTGGWEQIGAIFESNSCTGCHNQSSESGLDLTSYEGFVNGGNKCGTNIHNGNTLAQIIQVEGYDECGEPISGLSMNNRVNNQLDAFEIAAIQAWIDAGAPEGNACQDRVEDRTNEGTTGDEETDNDQESDDDEADNDDGANDEEESNDEEDSNDEEGGDGQDDMADDEDSNDQDGAENPVPVVDYDGPTRLFPNPTKGPVNIETATTNFVRGVSVYDMGGKLVYQEYSEDKGIDAFDLRHLNQQGVYTVRLVGKFDDGTVESYHKILLE